MYKFIIRKRDSYMVNTKILADNIVDSLITKLHSCTLPAFKSIYITGSYCRGDWLNNNSDLDIHMIHNDDNAIYREDNHEHVKSIVSEALCGRDFPSHCPGGIDYGFNNVANIPKSHDEACIPSPYAYFSTLMFDFKANNITVYGENINDLLPETPNPKKHARAWFHMLVERIKNIKTDDSKLSYNIYKTILAAQIHYGEMTINKYRMLELYQKHIPDFSMKWFGEMVIRNYTGSIYPYRVPLQFPHADYLLFVDELAQNITNL